MCRRYCSESRHGRGRDRKYVRESSSLDGRGNKDGTVKLVETIDIIQIVQLLAIVEMSQQQRWLSQWDS